eukprot:s2067_g15.t1
MACDMDVTCHMLQRHLREDQGLWSMNPRQRRPGTEDPEPAPGAEVIVLHPEAKFPWPIRLCPIRAELEAREKRDKKQAREASAAEASAASMPRSSASGASQMSAVPVANLQYRAPPASMGPPPSNAPKVPPPSPPSVTSASAGVTGPGMPVSAYTGMPAAHGQQTYGQQTHGSQYWIPSPNPCCNISSR